MTISVGPLEAFWILVNVITFSLTLTALVDARADRAAVKLLNGHAREVAASGVVHREMIRVAVQALLLTVAVPGLFVERDINLTLPVAALMAVPALLLLSSFLDARDRKALTVLVAADLLSRTNDNFSRLERKIDDNTAISQEASDKATAAYHEANTVNIKLERQGDALILQGEERAERLAATEATVDDTHEKVTELHEGTAPERRT